MKYHYYWILYEAQGRLAAFAIETHLSHYGLLVLSSLSTSFPLIILSLFLHLSVSLSSSFSDYPFSPYFPLSIPPLSLFPPMLLNCQLSVSDLPAAIAGYYANLPPLANELQLGSLRAAGVPMPLLNGNLPFDWTWIATVNPQLESLITISTAW